MTFVFVPVLRVLIVHRLVVNHQKVLRLAILDILGEIEASRDDRVVINDRNLVVGDGMLSVDQGADSRMGQRRGFRVGSNRFDVDLSEREPETKLIDHLRNFLVKLGKGLAFVGSQYHLEVAGQDYRCPMPCCNVLLQCCG
jgi:hypothetical protein